MPMRFLFDQVEGHYVKENDQGLLEINRPVLVVDIPIDAGDSDPKVFLKVLKDAGCPARGSAYPDTDVAFCKLRERNLRNVKSNSAAILDLIYRGTSLVAGGGGITYTLEDAHVTEVFPVFGTLAGAPITVRYKKGGLALNAGVVPGMVEKGSPVPKIRSHRVLRARGSADKDYWLSIRGTIKALRNSINSVAWGGDPRGTWMFMGPTTTYATNSSRYDIQLDFLEGIGGHFPVSGYFDEHGNHPADCDAEETIRAAGPPGFGNQQRGNGITISSIYPEANFNTYFNFTP